MPNIILCLVMLAAAVMAAGCTDNRSSIPPTAADDSQQAQAAEDKPTMPDNERYDNPVDKKTYVAPGGWKEYQPSSPREPKDNARIQNKGIRLLTAQKEIAQRTTVEALVAFFKRIDASAQSTLADVPTKATILAQFACSPGKHEVQISHQGDVTQEKLQSFYQALVALEAMPVSSGEVSFQLTIEIDPTKEK